MQQESTRHPAGTRFRQKLAILQEFRKQLLDPDLLVPAPTAEVGAIQNSTYDQTDTMEPRTFTTNGHETQAELRD